MVVVVGGVCGCAYLTWDSFPSALVFVFSVALLVYSEAVLFFSLAWGYGIGMGAYHSLKNKPTTTRPFELRFLAMMQAR